MRSGVAAVQNTLTPPAQNVLRHAISNAQGRGHTHVQPLHVALALLSHGGPLLRQACADLHTQASHGLQQCHALELCFNVALDRLPQSSSSSNTHPLALSNALVAALKRAQAHQKRGCPEQQQPPLVAVKVEIEQLIISILEDPSVSRVMKEAGFVSQQVKTNLENAISLSSSLQQGPGNHNSQKSLPSDVEPPLVGCVETRPPVLPSPLITLKRTEDQKLLCCPECTSHFNAEYKQLQAQGSAQAEVAVSPLPSWLQKEKDLKSEQEKCHSLSQKLQDLQRKWQCFCSNSHSARDMALCMIPPHTRMESNILDITNNLGLMAANSTPLQSVDFTSLPTPKPSEALNFPHWTRSLPSIAPVEGSPRSNQCDAIGRKSQALEEQATSISEDSINKVDSLQFGGLKPVEQPRPQPSPSPLSRLHANLPKSFTNGCPLQSPLSALKASKPLSKSPLMANSPLSQKLPAMSMSSLSQPLDTSVDFTSLPTPKPSEALNRPHGARSLPSIAPVEGSPRSIHSDAIGSKSQALEEQATSVSEDSINKVDSLQFGGLKPVEQPRPQPSPSPLSRLHANLPKSFTSGCPLRSPLSALKASKPLSKSPLLANSPLSQKLPPKSRSALSQPLETSLKDAKTPIFFDQKAAERLKHVYKGVLDKVSWQSNAISQIATALVNTQSGMGKLRGLAARADTWLLLLGPDQVGKRLIADALAELVMGHGKKPLCFGSIQGSRWGRKDEDGEQHPRSRTTLDSLADALRTNPLCVLLLENIDQADSVVRMNLVKAMETGKFMDSSARQLNVGNAIILMTSKVGTESLSANDNPFSEEKVSLLHGARMKLALELSVENKEVVLQGDHNISVVKDATLAPVVENVNLLLPLKRKPASFLKQAVSMHSEKRPKLMARIVSLDLNLSAEENEAGACQEESGITQESKACPVLTAAQEELSPRFFNLVDSAVVFEPFDMMGQANWVLSQLANACSGFRVEVDFQLLEHMVGTLWRTPGGNQAFEAWVQEKLKATLNAFTGVVLGDRVLRFVYEDSFSKELCSASELPLQIEVGSR